jgi:putative photosynthetic complex assembly protein 2
MTDFTALLAAALFAAFVWWFSTGLVLLADGLPRATYPATLAAGALLAVAGGAAVIHASALATTASAYLAFGGTLLIWAWIELSFLTGWITGPRRIALPDGQGGLVRFRMAVAAILWHEAAILLAGVALIALTWGEPNPTAALTFAVLWVMRTSAKLNLFFGVRNLNDELLPPHLRYLRSYFRRRSMNGFFPFALALAGVALVLFAREAFDPAAPLPLRIGVTLAGTMLLLAIIEHLLLVLPFNANALWGWAQRHRHDVDDDPTIRSNARPAQAR